MRIGEYWGSSSRFLLIPMKKIGEMFHSVKDRRIGGIVPFF